MVRIGESAQKIDRARLDMEARSPGVAQALKQLLVPSRLCFEKQHAPPAAGDDMGGSAVILRPIPFQFVRSELGLVGVRLLLVAESVRDRERVQAQFQIDPAFTDLLLSLLADLADD